MQPDRINNISTYLKEKFNSKVIKLSIDAGLTCPNRDGLKDTRGCLFCSQGGSGELATDIDDQIKRYEEKWPNAKYLAYFQSNTNTYGEPENLKKMFFESIDNRDVIGIAISTRPDCLNEEIIKILNEINRETFLWVELGLQSIHQKTMDRMNLCYTLDDFKRSYETLSNNNIRCVPHLIFGFPEETEEDYLESVKFISDIKPFGVKYHMLNIVKGSPLANEIPDYSSFQSIDEYTDFIVKAIRNTKKDITIHRLTGDVPRKILLTPTWSYMKRTILNEIHRKLKEKDAYQGDMV